MNFKQSYPTAFMESCKSAVGRMLAHWTVVTDEMPPQKIAGTVYSLIMYGYFMDAIDD